MADLTFTHMLASLAARDHGPPPTKRKRLEPADPTPKASEIPDNRVTVAQALRLDCDFITITVGRDEPKASFKVHEDAICDRSEFFRSAMKPEWANMRPDPRIIDLPEDDPDAFSLYRTWMYSGKLAIMPPTDSTAVAASSNSDSQISNDPRTSDLDSHYHTLAYAYVLGERLMDTSFKNAIADVYVLYARGSAANRRYPSNEEIRILYDGTREGSPIRQLLVDIWYYRGKVEWIEKDANLPKEFLVAVVRELLKVRGDAVVRGDARSLDSLSRPWKLTHVQYHEI